MTIPDHDANSLLEDTAGRRPDDTFLLYEDPDGKLIEISYAEQVTRAVTVASVLTAQGIRPDDRVLLIMGNRPEFLDVWFACGRIGAVVVPVNPASTSAETRHVWKASRATLAVVDHSSRGAVASADIRSITPSDLSAAPDQVSQEPHRARSGLASIMFTSGTTSKPKGVRVTHANYVRVGTFMAEHLAMARHDRWLVTLPLFHANAQYYCLMSALARGASIALTSRFSASQWPRQARTMQATLASLFAAPIRMILARSTPTPDDDASDLRLVLFAQNVSDEQAQEFERRFGTRLVQLYGMTETVLPPFINPPDDNRRWDSVGRQNPAFDIALLDDGKPVGPGVVGKLAIRGRPGIDLTDGYDDDPQQVSALADGWLHTGDILRVDGEYAYFVDRSKDMIKRAGENIAATEIERVLNAHPAVLESAVHGVPDEVYDEAIVAHVVLRPNVSASEAELVDWCQSRLSSFKTPSQIVVRSGLPRTSVGKIRKDVLRAQASSDGVCDQPTTP